MSEYNIQRANKFLLGGVNKNKNFLGLGTMKTAAYGWAELGIKVAPLFFIIYGASKLNIKINISKSQSI